MNSKLYMTKTRIQSHQATIAQIDSKLAEIPRSLKTGDNVVYTALWVYRQQLAADLIRVGVKPRRCSHERRAIYT